MVANFENGNHHCARSPRPRKAVVFTCHRPKAMSVSGPSVWTGRALQAESDDLERLVLRFCIRPIDGAFELLAIMDIRARSISFATRPRRPDGPPDHERAGETFSPSPLSDSQTSRESQLLPSGISLSRQAFPW